MPDFKPAHIRAHAFSSDERLARVQVFCESHLSEPITLAKAARVAGLEYCYFSTFFHDKTGVCFGDWLKYLRICRARNLIRAGEYSLSEVAIRSGFTNPRTFQRAFHRFAGVSPSHYRHQQRTSNKPFDPYQLRLGWNPKGLNESVRLADIMRR